MDESTKYDVEYTGDIIPEVQDYLRSYVLSKIKEEGHE